MRATKVGAVVLGAWLGLSLQLPSSRATQTSPPSPLVQSVAGFRIPVTNMDRSVDFYSKALLFETVSDTGVSGVESSLVAEPGARMRVVRMELGGDVIELVQHLGERGAPDPVPTPHAPRSLAILVNDIDQVYLWLRRHRVEPVPPGRDGRLDWSASEAGLEAFFVQDPDGHPLQVRQFQTDTSYSRWRPRGERVIVGIAHIAIGVADTEASLAFYRDMLGMKVVGQRDGWYPDLERLNNGPAARLRITTLRAASGPAIELLEYRNARGEAAPWLGAPAGDSEQPQRILLATDARPRAGALATPGVHPDSSWGRMAPRGVPGLAEGVVLRDPTGHTVELSPG